MVIAYPQDHFLRSNWEYQLCLDSLRHPLLAPIRLSQKNWSHEYGGDLLSDLHHQTTRTFRKWTILHFRTLFINYGSLYSSNTSSSNRTLFIFESNILTHPQIHTINGMCFHLEKSWHFKNLIWWTLPRKRLYYPHQSVRPFQFHGIVILMLEKLDKRTWSFIRD